MPTAVSVAVPTAPSPYAVGVEAAGSQLEQKRERQEQPGLVIGGEGAR